LARKMRRQAVLAAKAAAEVSTTSLHSSYQSVASTLVRASLRPAGLLGRFQTPLQASRAWQRTCCPVDPGLNVEGACSTHCSSASPCLVTH
jgi:hypothetical protein